MKKQKTKKREYVAAANEAVSIAKQLQAENKTLSRLLAFAMLALLFVTGLTIADKWTSSPAPAPAPAHNHSRAAVVDSESMPGQWLDSREGGSNGQ